MESLTRVEGVESIKNPVKEPKNSKKCSENNKIVVDSDDEISSDSDCDNTNNTNNTNNTDDKDKQFHLEEESEFLKHCEDVLQKVTKNYKDLREEIRSLMKLHKKELKAMKKKKPRSSKEQTGFTKPTLVPDKFLTFLKLEKGSKLSRTELTGLLCQEFKKRNLYHKNDRRIILPDDDVRKLFNLSKEADKSNNPKDKNGLNFYNLQKYIANCYNEFNNAKTIENNIENNIKNNDNESLKIQDFPLTNTNKRRIISK